MCALGIILSLVNLANSWRICSYVSSKPKFGEIPFKNNFTIIIDNGGYQTKNVHWKWSLGITFKYPEKIIIKDPAFSHTTQKRFETVLEHELNHLWYLH